MSFMASCMRLLYLCLFVYVALAILYTTQYLFLSPVVDLLPSLRFVSVLLWMGSPTSDPAPPDKAVVQAPLPVDLLDSIWSEDSSASASAVYFTPTVLARELGMDNALRTPVSQVTFLGKAFTGAMHPTRIIPFYYRASANVSASDITITTLVTANRFKVFRQLVERYRGPVSVTIHIPFPSDASFSSLPSTHPSVTALRRLHTLYTSSSLFSTYVDVHLALSPFASSVHPTASRNVFGSAGTESAVPENDGEGEGGRQFNVWRNAARLFARTEFVMMLDVDFAICTDWRAAVRDAIRHAEGHSQTESAPRRNDKDSNIRLSDADLVRKLTNGTAALVVPAFEYINLRDGVNQMNFPTDKETLLRLTHASPPVLTSFHALWAPGHNSTDYGRYYSIPPGSGEAYRVTHYQSAYEPYVIVSKRVTWCDERFTGYGANKAACLFEMYLSGVSFYVLADHFLIHQSHTYEEEARREERKYNRKLYADFKEEACLRYLDRYANRGTSPTLLGNAEEECKKVSAKWVHLKADRQHVG